jgi:hypothetical protein
MNPFQNRIISPTLRFVHHALRIIFLFQQSVFIRVHPWFKLFLLMFFPGSFCMSVMAAPITFQSSETQTSLLELYTSEGCSSCPPAESWLSRLKESPGLWKDFVPVAFHVDYWNYLGWRDPWSTKAFTDRQHAYARTWRNDSVYTPGLVLNGRERRTWSRSQSVPMSTAQPGILKVTSTDLKNWDVTFTPTVPSADTYEAHTALLASGLTSDVKAGENKGRRLEHDFIVISLNGCRLKPDGNNIWGSFEFGPANETPPRADALAVWITHRGELEVLQATGGWLPSSH